jgi:hypothetical protein
MVAVIPSTPSTKGIMVRKEPHGSIVPPQDMAMRKDVLEDMKMKPPI